MRYPTDDPMDAHTLMGVRAGRFESTPLTFWDEGSGPLWIYRETLGPVGVIRARSWETAWECAVDEVMYDADPEYLQDPGYDVPDGELPECCHYRSNGVPSNPDRSSAIAFEDPNGARLDPLSAELMAEYGIVLIWE